MKYSSSWVLGAVAVFVVLVLAAVAPLNAQNPPAKEQPQQPAKNPAQPGQPAAQPGTPAEPVVDKEEQDAFSAFSKTKDGGDVKGVIAGGEAFLKKYPESKFRGLVYAWLTPSYLFAGEYEKMVVAGEKALEMSPDSPDVLAVMSYGMARRLNPNDLDFEQKADKAEKYGKHGIELFTNLQKPQHLSEEAFAQAKSEGLSMCHSALGVTYWRRQRYVDSAGEFEQATKLSPSPDPTDWFLLGVQYEQLKRHSDATTAFGKCAEFDSQWQSSCKKSAEMNKKLAEQTPAAPAKP